MCIRDSNLRGATIGNVAEVAFKHGGIESQHASGHGVFGVAVLQLNRVHEQGLDLGLELRGPEVRVFQLELVDQINAEVAVHGLVAQDVLVPVSYTHLTLPTIYSV